MLFKMIYSMWLLPDPDPKLFQAGNSSSCPGGVAFFQSFKMENGNL